MLLAIMLGMRGGAAHKGTAKVKGITIAHGTSKTSTYHLIHDLGMQNAIHSVSNRLLAKEYKEKESMVD